MALASLGLYKTFHQIDLATNYILDLGVLQLKCSHKGTLDSLSEMTAQCGEFCTTSLCIDKFRAGPFS